MPIGVIEGVLIDDEPRMAGALEHLHEFAERDIPLHGDDVGARHHDIHDAPLAQAEDVAEHRALGRRETGLAARHLPARP